MDEFARKLNGVLMETFRSIVKIEEQALRKTGRMDLSISEMHLLESVGKGAEQGRTISDLAEDLRITLPSVTVAINKLAKKDYVEKVKATDDGRRVYVVLTKKGRRIDAVHRYFHENMVRNVSGGMTAEEKEVLLKGISKLNAYFVRKLEAEERE